MTRRRQKSPAPRLIAIDGPVGVGKSTLARFVAERLGARAVYEAVEENAFLKNFYADPRRYAFQTQLFFLLSRYQQQLDMKQEDLFVKTTVCDYVFQKDRIFACLSLNEQELGLYDRIYQLLDPRVPTPDLVVYLQARPEVLMERLRTRNREWERPITADYVAQVSEAYNQYFFHYRRSPLLVVNTSDIDFVDHEEHLEPVLDAILRMRKGVQHFNPKIGAPKSRGPYEKTLG